MKEKGTQKGFSILEPLLAIGIMAAVLLAITSLLTTSNFTTGKTQNYERALWYAEEGINALKGMSFEDLFITSSGSLHFVASSTDFGVWQLQENGPENSGNLTRDIKVSEVLRNEVCELTENESGATDPDSLKLESIVSWQDLTGITREISVDSVRTNWQNPVGECFADTDLSQLAFDFSGTMWFGGKQLRNIFITNVGTRDVEIDKVRLTWNYPFLIQQMFIGQVKVWSSAGPGTPAGNQQSGVELDIENKVIEVGETVEMEKTQFTGLMEGSIISIKVTMPDGSSTTTEEFMPDF